MKFKYILMTLALTVSVLACDDFLEEPPSKEGVIPDKVSDLQKFYFGGSTRNTSFYRALSNDDVELPFNAYDIEARAGFSKYSYQFYPVLFQRDYISASSGGNGVLWSSCYSRIYNDNYVLSMADSEDLEGTSDERKTLKSYAHFDRAYQMFELVTNYCQPWKPGVNDNELGIVLKSEYTLEFDENNLGRKSLKESYDFIEKDLLASFNVIDDDETWRITLKAAYAFTARFYLVKGDYNEALKYANLALEKNQIIDDYTQYTKRTEYLRGIAIDVISEIYDATIISDYKVLDVKSEYFIDAMQIMGNLFIPSTELLNLYQDNDVRKGFFPENGLAAQGYMKSKTSIATTGKWPFYAAYGKGGTALCFPNVAEMMLIKAECLVKTNNDLAGAKTILNDLRLKRIQNYNPETVNAISETEEMLNFIYQERRRERPFLLRGFDIRRLKAIEGKTFEIKRQFFEITENRVSVPVVAKEYVFTEKDYANKLYEGDITLSNGYLQQNP